jgi:hypothetical protein
MESKELNINKYLLNLLGIINTPYTYNTLKLALINKLSRYGRDKYYISDEVQSFLDLSNNIVIIDNLVNIIINRYIDINEEKLTEISFYYSYELPDYSRYNPI